VRTGAKVLFLFNNKRRNFGSRFTGGFFLSLVYYANVLLLLLLFNFFLFKKLV